MLCWLLVEPSEFESEYGHTDDCLLSDALWTCSNMFDTAYVLAESLTQSFVSVDIIISMVVTLRSCVL